MSKIDGYSERSENFEDDREIHTGAELEKYRDQIEKSFHDKLKKENPGSPVTVSVLFTFKN